MVKLKIQAINPFLPVYEVEGKGYELGLQIGKKCKERIQKTIIPSNNWFIERKERDKNNPDFLENTLKITKQKLPQYVDEIRGYADGANIDFKDIWILNSADYGTEESCSDVILQSPDKIVMGHNEDFNNANSDLSYFLHIKTDSCEFFSHTYPGVVTGFSFGMNSYGITVSCNSIPNTDKTMGVSRKILDRWALESKTTDEFIQRISFKPRSGTFSYNVASMTEFKAKNIETTEDDIYITEPKKFFYHTNHYLCEKWIPKNKTKDSSSTSFSRYNRLKEIVPGAKITPTSALSCISDSKVFSSELEIYPGWYGKSFCSVIYEISSEIIKMEIWPYSRDSSSIIKVLLHNEVN